MHQPRDFVGPFDQFEPRTRKQIPETCLLPFGGGIKTVKIKVPDLEVSGGEFVTFNHGVARAFDPSLDSQRCKKIPGPGGLASTQVALKGNEGVIDHGAAGKLLGEPLGLILTIKCDSFYNLHVTINSTQLISDIRIWAKDCGFSQIGVAGVDLSLAEPGLLAWLAKGFHGEMGYMQAHGLKRARPAELVPGTLSVITARMDYLHSVDSGNWQRDEFQRLGKPKEGVISLYARGRDYHKVMRSRLQKLCEKIEASIGSFGYRVFTDSAPVMEAELAARSGLGWRGKHTLILNRQAGSMFFLGEIFVDLKLPESEPVSPHCGSCNACIQICPTQAILAPYELDARRCISYLTIEHSGSIPPALRQAIGNRIYGCDDCQLACPWNKYAQLTDLTEFRAREALSGLTLLDYFSWTPEKFLQVTEGSAIRRIGHTQWLRNLAVALGNALRNRFDPAIVEALSDKLDHPSELVREHVLWALNQAKQE